MKCRFIQHLSTVSTTLCVAAAFAFGLHHLPGSAVRFFSLFGHTELYLIVAGMLGIFPAIRLCLLLAQTYKKAQIEKRAQRRFRYSWKRAVLNYSPSRPVVGGAGMRYFSESIARRHRSPFPKHSGKLWR